MCDTITQLNVTGVKYGYKVVATRKDTPVLSCVMLEPIPLGPWVSAPKHPAPENPGCSLVCALRIDSLLLTSLYASSSWASQHNGMWNVFQDLEDAKKGVWHLANNLEDGRSRVIKVELGGIIHAAETFIYNHTSMPTYLAQQIRFVSFM